MWLSLVRAPAKGKSKLLLAKLIRRKTQGLSKLRNLEVASSNLAMGIICLWLKFVHFF